MAKILVIDDEPSILHAFRRAFHDPDDVLLTAANGDEGGGGTTVSGHLNSTPGSTFTIELFSNSACDPQGFGEGGVRLAALILTTNGNGIAAFTRTLAVSVGAGQAITATATDNATHNPSESSACRTVQ